MTKISFELAEVFKDSRYVAYLPDYQKKYGTCFPGWERIEFQIRELTLTQMHLAVEDKFDFVTWGCKVMLRVAGNNPEDFFNRIESSLEFLLQKFQGVNH